MKKTTIISLLIAGATAANAATLAINDAVSAANQSGAGPHAGEGAVVKLFTTASSAQTQTAMPNGNRFRIGFFSNLGVAEVGTSVANLGAAATRGMSALNLEASKFVPLGEGASGDGRGGLIASTSLSTAAFGGIDGRLNKSFTGFTWSGDGSTANQNVAGGLPKGTRLFLMIFDSATTTGDGNWGLFSADTWVVPAAIGTNTTFTIRLEDVDTPAEVLRGSLGSLHLAPTVPEASSSALALLAGLGLMSRRRR